MLRRQGLLAGIVMGWIHRRGSSQSRYGAEKPWERDEKVSHIRRAEVYTCREHDFSGGEPAEVERSRSLPAQLATQETGQGTTRVQGFVYVLRSEMMLDWDQQRSFLLLLDCKIMEDKSLSNAELYPEFGGFFQMNVGNRMLGGPGSRYPT